MTSDRRRTADGPSPELERACAVATIVDTGCDGAADVSRIAEDLCARGINRLMVEGGRTVLTQFLTADLVDELHLVVAPMFVETPVRPGSSATGASRGIPTAGRTWPACGRSVTWRC